MSKTVKISEKNYNKLHDIKNIQGLKSIDQVMDTIIPKGVVTENNFKMQTPAFNLKDIIVSWDNLKEANINTVWNSDDGTENAVMIFKDNYGALIRFQIINDFSIEYYHFL